MDAPFVVDDKPMRDRLRAMAWQAEREHPHDERRRLARFRDLLENHSDCHVLFDWRGMNALLSMLDSVDARAAQYTDQRMEERVAEIERVAELRIKRAAERVKAEQRIEGALTKLRQHLTFRYLLPTGKQLGNAVDTDLVQCGQGFARIAAKLKPGQKVKDAMTQNEMIRLFQGA
jgi:hypothetical protein